MPDYNKHSEEHILIEGCKMGKMLAQKAVYDRFSSKMFAVCLRYASDYHAAEDILQDGFVKVFKYIEKYRGDGSFEGWIRRIFVNTSIEHYRKINNNVSLVDNYKENAQMYEGDAIEVLQAQDLYKLIDELSPGYKTVFNLYVIDGFSHQEIADQLGISDGTSKSQLARARQILQQKINDYHKVNIK